MTLAQWTHFGPSMQPTVVFDLGDSDEEVPAGQQGWLRYKGLGQFSGVGVSVPSASGGLPRGRTQGTILARLGAIQRTVQGSIGNIVGITFMQSQENVRFGDGSCYAAALVAPYASGHFIALYKCLAGVNVLAALEGASPLFTTLAQSPVFPPLWPLNASIYLGVQWDASALVVSLLGGPIINVTVSDYPLLGSQFPVPNCYNIVDTNSPLSTSVAEGFFVQGTNAPGNQGIYSAGYCDRFVVFGP
jgi:hypothetical protein